MGKEETASGGLLSKVVRFVRNPTVDWRDLDAIGADRESQYSKQMLKEMIERKRRNDFVRRREFDQLRKLRQRDALAGQRAEDPAARPSFFQSSLTSPGERAVTIQKIDEIEAQMSMQWWKGKQVGDAPPQPSGFALPAAEHGAAEGGTAFAPTAPVSLPLQLEPQAAAAPLFADDSMCITAFGAVPAREPLGGVAGSQAAHGAQALEPLEQEVFVHEPDLEEAAIRFANGDHAGAEAGLMEVLEQHADDDAQQQFEIWMTLFDLYRATGQQDRFDSLALDFAARFDRSAPLWFSIPEQLGLVAQPQPQAAPARRDFSWNAPATLTLQALAALQAALLRAASPWSLDWSRLAAIDEAALPALANEFSRWAEQDVHIALVGAQALDALLKAHTPSGDRAGSPEWWRLRMAVLRCMGMPDEFELVALDYCVTYEVSPPSWSAPRCSAAEAGGAALHLADTAHDLLAPSPGGGADAPLAAQPGGAPALRGHIEGDASAALAALEALARPGEPLVVPCECLIRVDFSAAGSVLNWAAQQQAQGRALQFRNLHRLVAVLFNVIGVSEHARIVPRKN